MRLINVDTLEFEEFDGEDIPRYGILSHRWHQDGEVTYQDVIAAGLCNVRKKGIDKILVFCNLAAQHGLRYAWVDTCCIDKSSSAELSEAINSMFRWYQLAQVCFAYLADINDNFLERSIWFSRAWTLQELIAPKHVLFYNGHWESLGSKSDLASVISAATGIPTGVLDYDLNIYNLPVAQRMSWARRRKSRRVEDIAYSLLGIFDVNMPLLYGEGKKAFRRLQEEIIKHYNDQTIFLWSSTPNDAGKLLASSPDAFDPNRTFHFKPSRRGKKPFSVTNLGLSITLSLVPWHTKTYLALLDCEVAVPGEVGEWQQHQPGLYLRRIPDSELFQKISFSGRDYGFLQSIDPRWRQVRDIHIALDDSSVTRDSTKPRGGLHRTPSKRWNEELYGFKIRSILLRPIGRPVDILSQCKIVTGHHWDESTRVLRMSPGTCGDAMIIGLAETANLPAGLDAVKLGFDFDFQPCCIIGKVSEDDEADLPKRGTQASTEALRDIDLSQKLELYDERPQPVVPLSFTGFWFLKADPQIGLSVILGPPVYIGEENQDCCFKGIQVGVRLTRELVDGKVGWVFDLSISLCSGTSCSSHLPPTHDILMPPEIIISPP